MSVIAKNNNKNPVPEWNLSHLKVSKLLLFKNPKIAAAGHGIFADLSSFKASIGFVDEV